MVTIKIFTPEKCAMYAMAFSIAAKAKATIIDVMQFDELNDIGFTVTDYATLERVVEIMNHKKGWYNNTILTTNTHSFVDLLSLDEKMFITFRTQQTGK